MMSAGLETVIGKSCEVKGAIITKGGVRVDGRVRNIPFVPQCYIFQRSDGIRPYNPRKPRDLLANDRISLVRHG